MPKEQDGAEARRRDVDSESSGAIHEKMSPQAFRT